MKYLIPFVCFLFSTMTHAGDFDFSKRFGLGGGAGWTFPVQGNEFDKMADDELMWSLHARYHMTAQDAFLFEFSNHEFSKTDIKARVFDLMYLNRLNPTHKMTPIIGIGAGLANMDNIEPYKGNAKFAAKARLGFEYAFNDYVVGTLFADYLFIGKMPGKKDNEALNGVPGREIYGIVPQFTLTVFFGEKKEKEEETKDPTVIIPIVAAGGTTTLAMDEDDDNDGVYNSKDKCSGTTPGARVNSYGCISREKAVVSIGVLFPKGGTELSIDSYPALNSLATFMFDQPQTKLEVQGHTDNTGTKNLNRTISQKRAEAVKSYLVEQGGVAPERITAYGYGDSAPVASNATERGREQNRRIMGVITE